MAKRSLPKNLSSLRTRSTSLSNKSLDWEHRTSERSGSAIISSLMKSGYRENTIEDKREVLIKRIKREETRVKKAKALGMPPVGRETQVDKDRTAYIARKEVIINNLHVQLQILNTQKQNIDRREENKRLNREAVQGNVLVKLQNKYVPYKSSLPVKQKSMAELVKEEKKKKKVFAPKIQEEIDKVFTKESIDREFLDEEMERLLNGED